MNFIDWDNFFLPYEQVVKELTIKFKGIGEQYKNLNNYNLIEKVEGRVKNADSILNKVQKKNVGLNLGDIEEKIEDIAGLRIICSFVEDVEKVIYLIRERDGFDINILEERDYISNTKKSGYTSYHIIINYPIMMCYGYKNIKAEIQIRTVFMNFWAEMEHYLKYKYDSSMPKYLEKKLISLANSASKLDKEMSDIRYEILDAQKTKKVKSDTVLEIMDNIQKLNNNINLSNVLEINKEFVKIYENGDLKKLLEFNKKLKESINIYTT